MLNLVPDSTLYKCIFYFIYYRKIIIEYVFVFSFFEKKSYFYLLKVLFNLKKKLYFEN